MHCVGPASAGMKGPDVGGDYGPYRQSERTHLYRQHVDQLLEAGHAYRCFCDADRLALVRKERHSKGYTTGYDGHCQHLAPVTAAQRGTNEAHTIRLKVPAEGTCTVDDPLRGEIEFEYQTVDHQILLKSDGFPTYHLANVVDDHLMGITHVIRGEEWLPSLPKHLLLYRYFDWQAPKVYHLPLLRNEDASKLSKRKNPTSILYYREMGILPETLLNFLGLMAYSMPDGREIFSLEELARDFNIQRISLGGPVFDQKKLIWLNQQHISQLGPQEILTRLVDWKLNQAYFEKLIPLVVNRLHRLGDFMKLCDFMFYSDVLYEIDELIPKNKGQEETRDLLYTMMWALESLEDFDAEQIEMTARGVAELSQWSIRDLSHICRIAITAKAVAPPLFQAMAVLGSDVCRQRLLKAIELIGALGKKKLTKLRKAFDYQWQAQQASGERKE